MIELSKRYHVNVYSNSDVSDMLRIQYCGSVDYWSELPQVFHMSKINLNFTIPNIKSGIPLRVWDVLGAGGFLMTNYQAEIPYYFKEGEDLICFDGIEDLCEKQNIIWHMRKNVWQSQKMVIESKGASQLYRENKYDAGYYRRK